MADMVEVYHETPWGCLLLGLVGHMGNFLDLEGLCGGVLAAGLMDLLEISDLSLP
jgi:hypothetical protein